MSAKHSSLTPTVDPATPDPKTRRQAGKEQTRQSLVISAHKLLLEEGLSGFSMKQICKRAGIAQPSFYNHYPTLNDLMLDVRARMIDIYLAPLQRKLQSLVDEIGNDISRINLRDLSQRYIEANVDSLLKDFVIFKEILSDHNNPNSPVQGALGKLVDEINDAWIAFMRRLASAYKIRISEKQLRIYIDSLAALTHALVFGCAQQRYSKKSAVHAIALLSEALIKDHMNGVRP